MPRFFLLLLLCLMSGCTNNQQDASLQSTAPKEAQESPLYSLNNSTHIIMQLIKNHKLATMLEQCDPQAINLLIKNFSPAQMALEAEALNWPQPVMLFFVHKDAPEYDKMHTTIEDAAKTYEGKIKFIEIDADELFKITEQFDFDALPALLAMNQRTEVARVEDVHKKDFKTELQKLITTAMQK